MGRVLAWAVLLACVASVGILPSAAVAVDEYVMAKIECPEKTVMKRNWKDKIGECSGFGHVVLCHDNIRDDLFILQYLGGQMAFRIGISRIGFINEVHLWVQLSPLN